jgi:hypothetical protein
MHEGLACRSGAAESASSKDSARLFISANSRRTIMSHCTLADFTYDRRIAMTAPRAPQWPLTPALRLGALALICALGAWITEGLLSQILWVGSVVLLVFAVIQLAKNWTRRR